MEHTERRQSVSPNATLYPGRSVRVCRRSLLVNKNRVKCHVFFTVNNAEIYRHRLNNRPSPGHSPANSSLSPLLLSATSQPLSATKQEVSMQYRC